MESNGKSATLDGLSEDNTGMIVWGGVGTSVQHSFFQLLHQGTRDVLVEFLLPLQPLDQGLEGSNKSDVNGKQGSKDDQNANTSVDLRRKHFKMLFANCLAQSRALMIGSNNPEINKHFQGDKPSITICYSKLTPAILGALIAEYEHKIYIQGLFWKINSFDQFGVELGKKLAKDVMMAMEDVDVDVDESTRAILRHRQCLNKKK